MYPPGMQKSAVPTARCTRLAAEANRPVEGNQRFGPHRPTAFPELSPQSGHQLTLLIFI
jgi:hypothetical protein